MIWPVPPAQRHLELGAQALPGRVEQQPAGEQLLREPDEQDLRGFGSSVTRPDDGRLDRVADLIDVLDALDIGHAHFVGASLGAGVAVELALARPDVVSSLLLCPPGGSLLAELTPDLAAFFAAEREALAANDLDAAVGANVDSSLVGAGRIPADVEPAAIDLVRTMQRRAFEVTADWGDLDEVELEPPALERLDEVDCQGPCPGRGP